MTQGSPRPPLKRCPRCSRFFPETSGQAVCANCRADQVDQMQAEIDQMERRGRVHPISREEKRS